MYARVINNMIHATAIFKVKEDGLEFCYSSNYRLTSWSNYIKWHEIQTWKIYDGPRYSNIQWDILTDDEAFLEMI